MRNSVNLIRGMTDAVFLKEEATEIKLFGHTDACLDWTLKGLLNKKGNECLQGVQEVSPNMMKRQR